MNPLKTLGELDWVNFRIKLFSPNNVREKAIRRLAF